MKPHTVDAASTDVEQAGFGVECDCATGLHFGCRKCHSYFTPQHAVCHYQSAHMHICTGKLGMQCMPCVHGCSQGNAEMMRGYGLPRVRGAGPTWAAPRTTKRQGAPSSCRAPGTLLALHRTVEVALEQGDDTKSIPRLLRDTCLVSAHWCVDKLSKSCRPVPSTCKAHRSTQTSPSRQHGKISTSGPLIFRA